MEKQKDNLDFGDNKKLGFGFFRLPLVGEKVDLAQTTMMVDEYMRAGFNYFDVARPYLNEQSESAFKICVADRYPREEYYVANKLTHEYFNSEQDIYDVFNSQLEACGVDYFDIYLMHCQIRANKVHFEKNRAYETAFELKKAGKIKHVGFSFHDNAEYLVELLERYPEIDVVQLQVNYYDFENDVIQARKNLEVCQRYKKPVIVMEPVKGGMLARLPKEAEALLAGLGNKKSNASYAIRFAVGCPGVQMVLSGMSDVTQMKDNIDTLKNYLPLNDEEQAVLKEINCIIDSNVYAQCTGCRYCVNGCPRNIRIPDLLALLNLKMNVKYNNQLDQYYWTVYTYESGKASDCIACGKCEKTCPQHLQIRDYLKKTERMFESQEGYLDELLDRIKSFKQHSNNFIIYGAGKFGKMAIDYLHANIPDINIIGVAVSNRVEEGAIYENIQMKCIEDYVDYKKEAMVLVMTINTRFIHEIYQKLDLLGFENILNLYS